MACKFNAPNGMKSKLYDKVYESYGHKTALNAWATIQTQEFKDWYKGELDINGEPVLKGLSFENSFLDTLPIQIIEEGSPINNAAAVEQIESLTQIFSELGVNVEVKANTEMADAGNVVTLNGKTTVTFNPRKVRGDTFFHEFGHIFIDLLGNDRVVKKGIENLRGSKLWEQVSNLYKDLDDFHLGKEVLTTAVGLEAQKLYDERVRIRNLKKGSILDKVKAWKAWFSNAVRMIGVRLGVNKNTALRLAYELTGSKKRYTLGGVLSTVVQQQKTRTVADVLDDSSKLKLNKDGSAYQLPSLKGISFARVTSVIDKIRGVFQRDAVIKKLVESTSPEWASFTSEEQLGMYWADKREEGTGIHNIAEDYIEARNSGKLREEAIAAAMGNLFKPKGGLDEEGIRFYEGMDRDIVANYIDNIADFIESLYEKNYQLFPEVKVYDPEMGGGIAGTIDLLIRKPDGKYMIWDWKTKEKGKFNDFYQKKTYGGKTKMFEGLMSDLEYTTADSYSLQLSTYQLMLERQGFEFADEPLAIIPLVGIAQTDFLNETRYHDVGLPQNIQGQNSFGVLPLRSLKERLKDVYEIKDDLEADLENINQSVEEQNELREKIDYDKAVEKWLQETIINLEKSISAARASAGGENAAKYEKRIRKLIAEMNVVDDNMAVVAYDKWVKAASKQMKGMFEDSVQEVTDDKGVVKKMIVRGFSSYTWQDIKHLEENDKEGFIKFMSFLINADMFLSQVSKVGKLPTSYGARINPIFSDLKRNLGTISDLEFKMQMLNQQMDLRYEEISSNPLSGGRGVLNANSDFFEAQRDLGLFGRYFDSLADSHNRYFANVMRSYAYKKREMEDDQNAELEKWYEKVKEYGGDIGKFIDPSTGKIIAEIDYERFQNERRAMYKTANRQFKFGTAGWNDIVNNWYAQNTEFVSEEERQYILDEKMKEFQGGFAGDFDQAGYDKWLSSQQYRIKGGSLVFKRNSPFYKPKLSEYGNSSFTQYTQKDKEFLDYLTKTLAYLTEHSKNSMVGKGYAPGVPKNMKGFMEQFLANMGWRNKGDYDQTKGVVTDVNDEIVNFLPFMFNNLLNQKKKLDYPVGTTTAEEVEIDKENKLIEEENKRLHAEALEQDLTKTMPIFIRTALENKHKKGMQFELLRVKRSFVENHKVKVMKNNLPVVDKVKHKMGLENFELEVSAKGSSMLKRYDDWLRMIFYDEFENDEGLMQKVSRILQNYTSFKSMALNPFSAMNNQVYGAISSKMEAASKEFFDSSDWRKASMEYAAGIVSYMGDDAENFEYSTKQSAFMHHIPIMMDFKEMGANENQTNSLGNVALKKLGWITNKVFIMEHLSEHNLQNRTLFAMARSHRVVKGRVIRFNEFKRGKIELVTKEEINTNPAKAKEKIAKNKELEKTLKEEFESHPTLYDSYEFTGGKLKLKKDVSIKKNEIAEFQMRVLGVNQYLHGIYNKEDAGAMQQYAIGRLAMQFRKWMRPGWTKRFGQDFGKSDWNERRSQYSEGMYVSTWNFLTTPIQDNYKAYLASKKANKEQDPNNEEASVQQVTALKAFSNIFGDYVKFFGNVKLHWHTLNETQQANIKRTFAEYLFFATAIMVGSLAKEMKGDDDDPPLPLMLLLHQADRTATELTTYVPISFAAKVDGVFVGGGWFNEAKKMTKSPLAVFGTMEHSVKLAKAIMMYPFSSDEDNTYQTGVYHGETKLSVLAQKSIPMWNQYQKFNYLAKNYKYYKLF
jgi:hypothetical protein